MSARRFKEHDFEREKAIGNRLSEIRNFLGYTQSQVASRLRITRERLASYERGRFPLKAHIGLAFCRKFGVNERWLATGIIPRYPCLFYFHHYLNEVGPSELLSSAYDRMYSGHDYDANTPKFQLNLLPESEKIEHVRTFFRCIMDDSLRVLPKELFIAYCLEILMTSETFFKEQGIKLYDAHVNEIIPALILKKSGKRSSKDQKKTQDQSVSDI